MITEARRFPWGSLESTSRAESTAVSRARRWAGDHVAIDAWARAFGPLFGGRCGVRIRRSGFLSNVAPFGEGVGVLFSTDDTERAPTACIEVEDALAAHVVARSLRRPAPAVVVGKREFAPAIGGAFAAMVVAAVRRCGGTTAFRLLDAGDAAPMERELALAGAAWIAVSLTILVDDEAYAARVLIADATIARAEPALFTADRLRSLGALPLSVPIVACTLRMTATEWASLDLGDVVVVPDWPLASGRERAAPAWIRASSVPSSGHGDARGEVRLAAPDGDAGVIARVVDGGRVVLGRGVGEPFRLEVEPLAPWEEEMAESESSPALVQAVGEVPIVVRVEIGEARMSAREWASLVSGDVLTLGRKIGERVALRVGGLVLAHGELVDVEGEVGVRLLERVAQDEAR